METTKKSFESANILDVEVGTTGYMGGDKGHGGETMVVISDSGSTAWDIDVKRDRFGDAQELRITLYGDTELHTFVHALEFMAEELRKKME